MGKVKLCPSRSWGLGYYFTPSLEQTVGGRDNTQAWQQVVRIAPGGGVSTHFRIRIRSGRMLKQASTVDALTILFCLCLCLLLLLLAVAQGFQIPIFC